MITDIEAVASGTHKGVNWRIALCPLKYFVNGYVELPKDHPWIGKDYDEIPVEIHGGLTYSTDNVIGFDTGHAFDLWSNEELAPAGGELPSSFLVDLSASPEKWIIHWTIDKVIAETKNLVEQVVKANDKV